MSNFFNIYEIGHFLATLLIAVFLCRYFKNWRLLAVCFFFGFFIDVDHLLDYFLFFGTRFNLANFFNTGTYMDGSGKIYVLFHGWEYLFFLWVGGELLSKKKKIPGLTEAMIFSYFTHLLLDQFSFSSFHLGYFLIYRLLNNFNLVAFKGI